MVFKTGNGNFYLYDKKTNRTGLLHPVLYQLIRLEKRGVDLRSWINKLAVGRSEIPLPGGASLEEVTYYYNKLLFMKAQGFFQESDNAEKINGRLTPGTVAHNLANNPHIIIEVTGSCNLACKYCTYGDLYEPQESRQNRSLDPQKAIMLIDYMVEKWNSPQNRSYKTGIRIGFYGGEPMLNMECIEKVHRYCGTVALKYNHFTFGMTTNGVLLDKYMEYLVENRFNLLISLDGDRKANGYRVFHDGSGAYEKIYANIKLLATSYPDYFEKYVRFSPVLHRLNTFPGIIQYFKKEFNKDVSISGLRGHGIRPGKRGEFQGMYKDKNKSLSRSPRRQEIDKKLKNFLECYSGCVFKSYGSLLSPPGDVDYLPTGTCTPFSGRLFLRVNGDILPCEHVGPEHVLGKVGEQGVGLCVEKIAQYYNGLFEKIRPQCQRCADLLSCPGCVMQMACTEDKLVCPSFTRSGGLKKKFTASFEELEREPRLYGRFLTGGGDE